MKKKILFLLLLFLVPFMVHASDDVIHSFDMDIYVSKDGTAHVTETWVATANMGSEFYRSYKNLGTSVIDNFTVSMDGVDYTFVNNWDIDASLSSKKYKNGFNYIDDGVELCFGKTSFGTHTYISKYTISNFVVDLNDSQMIYWTLLPENNGGSFKQIHIKIYSDEAYSDTLDVWGYGNYGGTCYVANGYIEMNLDRTLNDEEYMTILVKYPDNTFNLKTKLDKDFSYYLDMANFGSTHYDNSMYEIEKTVSKYFYPIVIGWSLLTIFVGIYLYFKFDKEHYSDFNIEYYREFPSNDSPAVVEYLFLERITSSGFSSSILNMIYKKAITVEEIQTKNFFGKTVKDYVLINNDSGFKEELTTEEAYLKDELFGLYGDSTGRFNLSALKNVSNSESAAKKLISMHDKWKKIVADEAKKRNFFEKNISIGQSILFVGFSFISVIAGFALASYGLIALVISFLNIVLAIYMSTIKKRTISGNDLYRKWKAFKKFLNDFGRFSTSELPEIHLWEKYLVYAHVFGIADKLRKEMEIKIPEVYSGSDISAFDYIYLNNVINNAVSSNVNAALASAHSKLASSYSSGGGGFSSGGGGGGSFGGGGGAGGR